MESIITDTDIVASTSSFPRAFPARNMNTRLPFMVVTTATLLNSTLDRGRDALANMRPVASATQSNPTTASMVTSRSA